MKPNTVHISAHSAGYNVGNYGKISVNSEPYVMFGRGLGVMVINEATGSEIGHYTFDTHDGNTASAEFVRLIAGLPTGRIVVIVVRDEATRRLSGDAKAAIMRLGAALIGQLRSRGSYALIGAKGAKPGTRPEKLNNNAAVSLEEDIALSSPEVPAKSQLLTVRSAGLPAGNTADILIDSTSVLVRRARGLNIVVFDDKLGGVLYERTFDTYASDAAATEFAALIDGVPDGRIVAVACMDECSNRLNAAAKSALASLGGQLYTKLRFRSSYALIGKKGASPGTRPEAIDPGYPVILNLEVDPFPSNEDIVAVRSAGLYAGNTVDVLIRNISMLVRTSRGLNVLAIEGRDNLVTRERWFDTHASSAAANDFAGFVQSLPQDCIVAVACRDECTQNLTAAARSALASIGGEQYKSVEYRDSYAIIGVKGAAAGSRPEIENVGAVLLKQPMLVPCVPERTLIVRSAGYSVGNTVDVLIGSQSVLHSTSRGLNVVIIDGNSMSVLRQDYFDTYASEQAANDFAAFVANQPDGRIVAVGCRDECTNKLNGRARQALKSIGGELFAQLQFRNSYALIGKKGAAPGSRPEVLDAGALVSVVEELGL